MSGRYSLSIQIDPNVADVRWLQERLREYNRSQVANAIHMSFLLTLIGSEDAIVGGLFAKVSYRWVFVDTLWVAEDVRGQGAGRNLLNEAENEARRNGCIGAWVDTFSFQARGFYEKAGYTVFGELPDHPPEHTRYFLRKSLT